MDKKIFLFTEAYSCGFVARKCLESFYKYHPKTKINVFGINTDFNEVGIFSNADYHVLDPSVHFHYSRGHAGTAYIWTQVIKEYAKEYDYIIHIDSDVIFRKEALSLIYDKIEEGYDLIGPVRCYKNNLNGIDNIRGYSDVTQTYFFGFNKNKISDLKPEVLSLMIEGIYNPLNHPVLDFFDPVAFDILHNGGKIAILNEDLVGGISNERGRVNKYSYLNSDMDFGELLFHFAGIGTGMRIYNKGMQDTNPGYGKWALERFALYYKLFYNRHIPDINIDEEKLVKLKEVLHETNLI
jgi:hypothetical protein